MPTCWPSALGLFVDHGEHLFETIDVALRFAVVFFGNYPGQFIRRS
jgi:hypothetical protein